MGILICPVCGQALKKAEKAYVCAQSHAYDIAKNGYINLLLSGSGRERGDNDEMVAARRAFLSGGYYRPLSDGLSALAKKYAGGDGQVLLDAGCGEGYYTAACAALLGADRVFGFDISRGAVKSRG